MIHLLWPTIRPEMMIQSFYHWVENRTSICRLRTHVAVNNERQKKRIEDINELNKNFYIHISGEKKGVTNACDYLTHLDQVDGPDSDIVILASDDFYAPKGWDQWLLDTMKKPVEAIRVNDGYTPLDNITIPIMTMGCLKKLNRIIYNKCYIHSYSDTELFYNLQELELLTDLWSSSPIFEHKNWANNKRPMDSADKALRGETLDADSSKYRHRMSLPVQERLK